MEKPNFWIALLAGAVVYFVITQIAGALLCASEFGRVDLPILHWTTREILSEIVFDLIVSFLTAQVFTAIGAVGKGSQLGFKIGAYCGLLTYISVATIKLVHGGSLMAITTYFLGYGISGGVSGAIFARVLHAPVEDSGSDEIESEVQE